MSLLDEQALRDLVRTAAREALLEGAGAIPAEYLPVAEAAEIVKVAPATIREWMALGRLKRYHAGRELRAATTSAAPSSRWRSSTARGRTSSRPSPTGRAATS